MLFWDRTQLVTETPSPIKYLRFEAHLFLRQKIKKEENRSDKQSKPTDKHHATQLGQGVFRTLTRPLGVGACDPPEH